MSTWVWVLTFTVLGTSPQHGQLAKFETRQECEQALKFQREQAQQQKKHLVGACNLTLKKQ